MLSYASIDLIYNFQIETKFNESTVQTHYKNYFAK